MKKVITKSVMLSLLVMMAVNGQAQTHWTYSYDATGNRTQRTVMSASARQRTLDSTNDLIADDKAKIVQNANHNRLKIENLWLYLHFLCSKNHKR